MCRKKKKAENDDDDLDVKVEDLLDDLTLNDKEENNSNNLHAEPLNKNDSEDFTNAGEEEVVDTFEKPNDKTSKKKQIGKRERTGQKIEEDK